MDGEVVDVEVREGNNHLAMIADPNETEKQNTTGNYTEAAVRNQDDDGIALPHVGMEFESEDAAKTFYDTIVRKDSHSDNWAVTKFVEEHNHSLGTPGKVLRPRRHFAGATKTMAETLDATNDVYVSTDGSHVPHEPNHVRNAFPVEPNNLVRNVAPLPATYFRAPGGRKSLGRDAHKEGAIAIETYNAAISNLKEGGTKIASVKKSVAKVTPYRSHFSGNSQEENNKKTPTAPHEMIPSLWPWQDAMPPRFNLNDGGVPCADLNQPSMAPVSIHRDGGPTDNSVVLTYFKSMTWVIENKTLTPDGKVAVINLKLNPEMSSMSCISQPCDLVTGFPAAASFYQFCNQELYNLLEFLWAPNSAHCYTILSSTRSWKITIRIQQLCCLHRKISEE
ncbi:hypothetical protein D5086_015517 [Populus alba]|uniref:Uncharacterized protein n=1 Tax=Populus alba TaxID=43335 RepID=A0ACC4BS10_POPAL